jgi:hypothetical protein
MSGGSGAAQRPVHKTRSILLRRYRKALKCSITAAADVWMVRGHVNSGRQSAGEVAAACGH